jgi:hypothetical protein
MALECSIRIACELHFENYSSVFTRTEEKLNDDRYQEALKFVADKRSMNSYRSTEDFLFCETFPEWRPKCRKYYNEKGPALKDDPDSSKQLIKLWDIVLSDLVLEVALTNLNGPKIKNWKVFKQGIHKILNQ